MVTDTAPTLWDLYDTGILFMARATISISAPLTERPDGTFDFRAEVTYGGRSETPDNASGDTAADQVFTLEFDYSTQSVKRFVSKEVVAKYGSEQIDDLGNLIGVGDNGPEGADVLVGSYSTTETHRFPDSIALNVDYRKLLKRMVGTVNDDEFREYEIGECLLSGVTGRRVGDGFWDLTFKFLGSPNCTFPEDDDCFISNGLGGGIEVLEKAGWDYLDIRMRDTEIVANDGSKFLARMPVEATVHRVYKRTDFSTLGIGT